jgi:hemoglobin
LKIITLDPRPVSGTPHVGFIARNAKEAPARRLTAAIERNPLMSVYDTIGGASAVRAAVDDFYARVLADARLAPFFAETDLERLKAHQRAFITAALGGPEIFAGRDMASAHAGLGIEDDDFGSVVGHLAGTLTGLGVPEDTIGQIGGALAPLRGDIVTTPAAGLAG